MLEQLESWDKAILFLLNHNHTPFLDWLMWQISGNLLWIPLYVYIIYALIKKYNKQGIFLIIVAIIAIGISDFTSVHLFKETIKRLRPCHNPLLADQIILVKNHCGGLYGFFSSHASNSFTLAIITSLWIRKKWYSLIIFLWATLIIISRVYLGVHYPSDVVTGALWGIVIGILFYYLSKKIISNYGQSKNR